MRERDCQAAERKLKQQLQRIRRLRGKRLVIKDGRIVTVFHTGDRETSRILRRTYDRDLNDAIPG